MTVFTRGSQVGARFSSTFYGEAATPTFAELAVDLSQRLTNMAANASSVSEAATTRMDYMDADGRRTIRVQCDLNNADTGPLFRHGQVNVERLGFPSAGNIRVDLNGTATTFAVAGLAAGSQLHDILWQTEPNPDTSGAATAMMSTLVIFNFVTGLRQRHKFIHPVKTAEVDVVVWGDDSPLGTNAFSNDIHKIGYDRVLITLGQVVEDWHTGTVVPPTTVGQEREWPPLYDSGIGNAGEFYGPAECFGARAQRQARRRTFSPIVNDVYRASATVLRVTTLTGDFFEDTDVDDGYRYFLPFIWYRPVPEAAGLLWVRIHAQSWIIFGSPVPIGFRLYSMDAHPKSDAITEIKYVGEIITRDDGVNGDGEWDINSTTSIVRDSKGWTWLALGVAVDPEETTGGDNFARFKVSAVHCVPRFQEQASGTLPLGGE